MVKNDFVQNIIDSIKSTANSKNIDISLVKELFIDAIKKVYIKKFTIENLLLEIDLDNYKFDCYRQLKVVEESNDPWEEISINDEDIKKQGLKIGDIYNQEFDLKLEFNRLEVQNISQIFSHSLNQIINKEIVEEFKDKKGSIIFGEVYNINEKNSGITVRLSNINNNKKEVFGFLSKKDQNKYENLLEGEKYHFVIEDVIESSKYWPIVLSRNSPKLVEYYMKNEIPEIQNDFIRIKKIARISGYKTKVLVESNNQTIKQPVSICIGPSGSRIKEISKKINFEKIEVYNYYEDLEKQLVALLSVDIDEEMYIATEFNNKEEVVFVAIYAPEEVIPKILGNKGLNIKLIYELLKVRIDIRLISKLEEDGLNYKSFSSFDLTIKNNSKDNLNNVAPINEEDLEVFDVGIENFTDENFSEELDELLNQYEKN